MQTQKVKFPQSILDSVKKIMLTKLTKNLFFFWWCSNFLSMFNVHTSPDWLCLCPLFPPCVNFTYLLLVAGIYHLFVHPPQPPSVWGEFFATASIPRVNKKVDYRNVLVFHWHFIWNMKIYIVHCILNIIQVILATQKFVNKKWVRVVKRFE